MQKFSAYAKDDVFKDIKLLARYDNITITETIERAFNLYIESRKSDLDFIKEQEQARLQRKNDA